MEVIKSGSHDSLNLCRRGVRQLWKDSCGKNIAVGERQVREWTEYKTNMTVQKSNVAAIPTTCSHPHLLDSLLAPLATEYTPIRRSDGTSMAEHVIRKKGSEMIVT